jgi:thiol:disulfide interchange protein DsbD
VLGFIGGLIALLTPCVFPMIPLTVSFFTKGQKNKAKGKEML